MAGPLVCGVDFSEPSRSGLALASGLARRLDRPLLAVHVLDSIVAQAAHAMHLGHGLEQRVRSELDQLARQATGAHPALRVEVGPAARTLVEVATAERASLIVVATQGLGQADGTWLGSTTQRVLRMSRVPVLAVPPGALPVAPEPDSLPFGRLVCGLDFGEASEEALRLAADLSRRLSMPLLAVHAIEEEPLPTILTELAEEANRRRLAEVRARLEATGAGLESPSMEVAIQDGDAESVLRQRVTELGKPPALLVVGLGGTDPHVRIGTTALRLLGDARVPILCVPPATLTPGAGA